MTVSYESPVAATPLGTTSRARTARVEMLRAQSLATEPWLSAERAELMTEFYRTAPAASTPVLRALAFRHLMERKTIYLGPGELIVGERGPEPKATPTYPELCCHTLEDLEILHTRPRIAYRVSDEVRRTYRNTIIPFWQGRSMREAIFCQMDDAWKAAYEAGVFTEFMEQRAPGHTVLDGKIYLTGMNGFKAIIDRTIGELDFVHDAEAYDKREELRAMAICADAVVRFAERHADLALELAAVEADGGRRAELEAIAEVCRRVPAEAPRTFHEALQAYWFAHLGVITELNTWDAFNPGHLDQHLYRFYARGLEDGTLTDERARELLQCLWIKFNNQPAPPKVGVTAAESGTYTDFANINCGGILPDGSDGVNDLTYVILDVIDDMHLLQPSSNVQLSRKSPDRFLRRACEIIREGWGQPSIFNADAVVDELLRQGKSLADARAGGTSGCVETGAFGKEAYILTGYFNLPKVLEVALNDGIDPVTGRRIGPATGPGPALSSFDAVVDAFAAQLRHFVRVKASGANIIERLYATAMPAPFLSILVDDCIARGRDYNDGGARYNTTYIMPVGIGTVTDSVSAIRRHVFERGEVSMPQLIEALASNFASAEPLRQTLWNRTPRYGNDDPDADAILTRLFDLVYEAVEGLPNTRGGCFHVNYLSTTCHVYFGSKVGASPDGRRAFEPLSEGISPVQGTDRRGPTAVLRSAAKMDHARTGGTLLNLKFAPEVLTTDAGLDRLAQLVRGYFALGGHHIQFNVVTAETLRAAQANPEKYRDLIVRVAGYSDYFCDLTKPLQDEIITRTAHGSF
jgi:pyruvate formate-lyase/glycerol dehydratase family glycyl radical enzyme